MDTRIIIAVCVSVIIIVGALFVREKLTDTQVVAPTQVTDNVTREGERQVVMIDAKGGYFPEVSVAKAGLPTVVRFSTTGTFDCSASVRIPSRDVSEVLSQTGTTDIDIGVNQVGLLEGSCGMGMYPFSITFIE